MHEDKKGNFMEFNGERYVSDLNSAQISYEHWHRYLYATQFVKGKNVLDIACGEGYGSDLLAQTAKTVTGIDISPETIDFAKAKYKKENLSFIEGSVGKIPVNGEKVFDVVVSFETIEHVDALMQESFLKEVKRLLKDDGIFIVSSPDKLFYSDIPNYKNEFHIKEFYEKEFFEFLHKYFKCVSLLGQKVISGSNMWRLNSNEQVGSFVEYKIANKEKKFVIDEQAKEAKYMVAVCSDKAIKTTDHSVLVDTSLSLLLEKNNEISEMQNRHIFELQAEQARNEELVKQLHAVQITVSYRVSQKLRSFNWLMVLYRHLKSSFSRFF